MALWCSIEYTVAYMPQQRTSQASRLKLVAHEHGRVRAVGACSCSPSTLLCKSTLLEVASTMISAATPLQHIVRYTGSMYKRAAVSWPVSAFWQLNVEIRLQKWRLWQRYTCLGLGVLLPSPLSVGSCRQLCAKAGKEASAKLPQTKLHWIRTCHGMHDIVVA